MQLVAVVVAAAYTVVAAVVAAAAGQTDPFHSLPEHQHMMLVHLFDMIVVVVAVVAAAVLDSVLRSKHCSRPFHWFEVVVVHRMLVVIVLAEVVAVVRSYSVVAVAAAVRSAAAAAVASGVPLVGPGTARPMVASNLDQIVGEVAEEEVVEALPSDRRQREGKEMRRDPVGWHCCFGNDCCYVSIAGGTGCG